jgi:TusA-related sulfurtransferase
MKSMTAGQTLEVVSSDRVILVDMPAWCRSTGNEYLGCRRSGERQFHLFVRKGGSESAEI